PQHDEQRILSYAIAALLQQLGIGRDLHLCSGVVELDHEHAAAARHLDARLGDDAREPDAMLRRAERSKRPAREACQVLFVDREQMTGERKAERRLFLEQLLL